ncbi:FtsX-like permease family protein [Campylobacter sp. 9BO]|uniref:ABC transporter permease n=1 Tax=Campylobacter sp. 9BO TaxID=3424759 RepID=UPI003D337DF1
MIGKNFINYAVVLLKKERADHAFSFFIFSFIIFILSSVLFISNSIQYDLVNSINTRPDIVVEALRGGKRDTMHDGYIYDFKQISGVSDAIGFVDGRYYFAQKRIWFNIVADNALGADEMVIGEGVKAAMNELYYEDVFNFLTEENLIPIKINKTAPHSTNIISNNTIYMHEDTAREVLSLDNAEYTKIFVSVANKNEISEVALKIMNLYPNTFAYTAEDSVADLKHIYYYKGGVFMVLYVVAMVAFLILLKNQISLVYGEKKREIAVLRSIGYAIKDIIALKFIQNFIVSFSAFLLGCALAYGYVFVFNAPLLREIFLGGDIQNFITFTPVIDFDILFLVFLFSVVPFLAFVIIPAWRVAISDMSEAIK